MMKDTGNKVGASEIRKQLGKLEAELNQIMDERWKNEAAVEESRRRTQKLLEEGSEIGSREGTLRKQIAEIQTVVDGLSR